MPTITMDTIRDVVNNLIKQKIKNLSSPKKIVTKVMDNVSLTNIHKNFQHASDKLQEDNPISISIAMFNTENNDLTNSAKGKLDPQQKDDEINTDTKYNLASVSKFILTLMVMRLVQEGKFSLNDTIDNYLHENAIDGMSKITISNLLSHRSGLRDSGFVTLNESEPITKILKATGKNIEVAKNNQFYYANINFVLIAKIIQNRTGKSLQECFENLITKPLNLNGIEIIKDGQSNQSVAVGYKINTYNTHMTNDSGNYIFGATSFRGTPSALVKLISSFFIDPSFISEHHRQAMLSSIKDEIFEVVTKTDTYRWPVKIGMGIEERSIEVDGAKLTMYGHGGWQDGSATFLVFVPQLKTAFCCCVTKTQGLALLKQSQQQSPHVFFRAYSPVVSKNNVANSSACNISPSLKYG